jgi:hypothetical protein
VKRIDAVLAAVVATGAIVLSIPGTMQATTLKSVHDPLGRFMIAVPATWNVQTSTSARAAALTAKAPARSGGLPDSVDVIVQDTFSPLSPQACVGEADTVMRFSIHSWTTIQQGATTLGGFPAYARSYAWRAPTGEQRRSIQSCVTMGRRAFMIVGTTADRPENVQRDLPQLQQIMDTFRPLSSTPPQAPATRILGER